ncbi:MAG TPA: T9SS type A sorting domain-containing protein [Marinilabiliaceae bacterium]|nr:T9SS type A sorting domain-containing protein [Marinilabiliaceae bacterium]
MRKIYLLIAIVALSMITLAQHTVTLKVIDNKNGTFTNNVDDNNETNVFCWAGNDDVTLSDVGGDWWYAMYSGEARCPGGELIIAEGVWTWQATFSDVPAGYYRWNPQMKTLGWKSINTIYEYNSEGHDIHFSIAEDGTITGQTTLELPLNATGISNVNDGFAIYTSNKQIFINSAVSSSIEVYDIAGRKIANVVSASNKEVISVTNSGIYVVIAENKAHKVIVK